MRQGLRQHPGGNETAVTAAGAGAPAAPPRPPVSGAEAPVWQLAWAGVAQVRSRAAGGRAASCLTWGGGVPSFPFPNSGADLSAFPRWRFGRKTPRTWEVGEHQLLLPRSGGTPGCLSWAQAVLGVPKLRQWAGRQLLQLGAARFPFRA